MQPTSLDYAPTLYPKWKRNALRATVLLLVTAIVTIAAWQIKNALAPAWWRWKISRARQVCATCTMPPTRAVLEFDGKDYPLRAPASPADDAIKTLAILSPASDVVFAHQRRTRGGASRIVLVGIDKFGLLSSHSAFDWKILLDRTTLDPKGYWASDGQDVPRADGSMLIRPYAGHPLTIYSGAVDPADESHFTIDYILDGRRGTIDGYIEDNPKAGWPEYIRLTDRPGSPPTSPATTFPRR